MRKRILSFILAVSALLVLTPDTAMAARMDEKASAVQETAEQATDEGTANGSSEMQGVGTETAPYRIKNAEQFRAFADMVNGVNGAPDSGLCAVLTCNIDLSGVCGADIGSWTPIGTNANPYTGIFDGGSFAITGLYYHQSNSSYVGLFGCNAGTIKNLGVAGADIAAGSYTGGVCGYNSGIITGCYNTSSVNGTDYTGGVCGYNNVSGTVSICYNMGAVSGRKYVGGICGYNRNTTINCYNMGSVYGKRTSIGGICGYNRVLVSNCYNAGAVSSGGRKYIGSVCGYNHSRSSFLNCYYLITGEEKGNYGLGMTQEQFASGEVCWLLNDGKSKNVVWYQTCGAGFPAFGGKVVYQVRRPGTGGRADEMIVAYTNETEKKQAPTNIVSAEENYYENNAEENIKAHIYAKPEWVWQEYDAAKAVFTCQDCGEKITLKASISEKTTEATCAKEGKIVYTASVVREGETYTDKKTEKLEKTAHQTLVPKSKIAETCTEPGISMECWICSACGKYFKEQEGKTEIPREEVEIPAKGHLYAKPEWDWNTEINPPVAIASFACGHGCGTIEKREGTVSSETNATCTEAGDTVYTAVVTFNGETYEAKESVNGKPIPHSYGKPEWKWADDYTSATATFTCAYRCGSTKIVADDIIEKNQTDATCIAEGKIEYTATVQLDDGREFTTTTEEKIPRKDHQYGNPKWEWADDNKSAVAIFTCTNNCGELESIKADVKITETQGASCGTPGEVKYTASVTFKGNPYNDFKTEKILIDHDPTHVPEVPATCESEGEAEYWKCSKCNKWFSDEACSNEIINKKVPVIPATGHTLVHVKDKLYRCTTCEVIFSITVASDGTIITMYSIEEDAIIMQDETENDTGADYLNEEKQNEAAPINEELPSQPDSEEKQEDSEPQDVDEKDIQNDQDEASMQNEQSESEEQNENKSSDANFDVPENAARYGLIYPEGEGEQADPMTADAWEGSVINLRAESAGKAAVQTVREQQQQGYRLWISVAVLFVLAGVVLVLLCKRKVIDDKR